MRASRIPEEKVEKSNTGLVFRVLVLVTDGGSVVPSIPPWVLDGLVKDTLCVLSSKSFVPLSDAHRSQPANVEVCLEKVCCFIRCVPLLLLIVCALSSLGISLVRFRLFQAHIC